MGAGKLGNGKTRPRAQVSGGASVWVIKDRELWLGEQKNSLRSGFEVKADLGVTPGRTPDFCLWTSVKRPSFLSFLRGERVGLYHLLSHVEEGGDGETGYGLEGLDRRETLSRGHFQTQAQSHSPC